jgi:AraC-like DNA-binding protein
MHERLAEQLTIDDLAHAALFSKFHFSRVFQRVTGLSPGRFLSALRLQEAKRLLRATTMPVTEISIQVGYSSVGTFSSRFKASVGLSPTKYRQLGRVNLSVPANGHCTEALCATVRGSIGSPLRDRPVFAGLFPDRIMQGRPISCTVLRRPGPYVLQDVPLGSWHLIAQSADGDMIGDQKLCVGAYGPIVIRPDTGTSLADVQLRPIRPLDPPVLLALGDLRSVRAG